MEHPFTWVGALGVPPKYQFVVTSLFVMAVIVALAARARATLQGEEALVPDGTLSVRTVFEVLTETMSELARGVIGHHSESYVPLFCSFFIFILLANLIGLVPGFSPPTSNFNITFALGTVSFLAFNYYGMKAQGVGYFKFLFGPVWWLAV